MKTFSAIATLVLAGLFAPAALADASKVTSCFGTEPFWGLTIAGKSVAFRTADGLTRTSDTSGARAALGTLTSYVALYQGKVKEEPGRFLNVIVKAEQCSDGMSDEGFPYSVLVLSGTELYSGCCRAGN
ncbi:MAG: hypothetical protein IOD12_18430 [Silvanigrellales bacterium]|nr:hypothetical protein [Silvanigrellales bacterium]